MIKNLRKIMISTGHGRLHLIQTASFLNLHNEKVYLLTGWITGNPKGVFVKIISILTGRKSLASGFERRITKIPKKQIKNNSLSEFLNHSLVLIHKLNFISKDLAVSIGWWLFSYSSRAYVKSVKPDIFHLRSGSGGAGLIHLAKKYHSKIVVDHSIAHPLFFDDYILPYVDKKDPIHFISFKKIFWRRAINDCKEADLVLVNSNFVKDTFIKNGFSKEKVKVIYLGVRDDFIGLKENYSRAKFFNLLFTGSFERRKGADYIIEAMKLFDKIDARINLTVVGTVSKNLDLSLLPKNITFVGHLPQDNLKDYLRESDAYLFPSLGEGCASSGMEAMAAGLPVIATIESGLPIRHKENGLVVESRNSSDIVSAVNSILDNLPLRKKIGVSAQSLISNNYRWSNYITNLKKLYDEL